MDCCCGRITMVTMKSILNSSTYESQHPLNTGKNPRMYLALRSDWSYVHTQLTMNRNFWKRKIAFVRSREMVQWVKALAE